MKDTVWLDEENDLLMYIDQTKLPNHESVCACNDAFELCDIIKRLSIRGAPAIGVGAAIGLYAAAKRFEDETEDGFLYSFRKTAVNLAYGVERMQKCAENSKGLGVEGIKSALKKEAIDIYNEDIETCKMIGIYGDTLIKDGMGILTHCNAGALATVRYGTALSPIYVANENGKKLRVYADETRPLLQGARLTAYELCENRIDVTLQCDNMVSSLMSQGLIDMVLVGADRVAANGDTANKIGTSGVAIIAKHYNIPFYVCAPFSTIDFNCKNGDEIIIEQRDGREVTEMHYTAPMSHKNVKVYNPAFDVTKSELITAIITEKGIFKSNELSK